MSETHGIFCPFNKGECYRADCGAFGGGCTAAANISEATKEAEEQARLNGMGSEREAKLQGRIAILERSHDQLAEQGEKLDAENQRLAGALAEGAKESDRWMKLAAANESAAVRLAVALNEVRDMIDGYADTEDGPESSVRPNIFMRIDTILDAALERK